MKQNQGEQTSMEAAEPEVASGVSPGEQLKAARLARGLSLSDVSSRLKLSIKKIESLEGDNVDGIAAPVFVAGYLRSYARLLELPEDDVLAGFATLSAMNAPLGDGASEDTVPETMASNPEGMNFPQLSSPLAGPVFRQAKAVIMIALIVLLASVAVYFLLKDNSETIDETQIAPVTSIEPELRTEQEMRTEPEMSAEPEVAQSPAEIDSQESAVTVPSPPESMTTIEAISSEPEATNAIEAKTRVVASEDSPADESAQNAAATEVFPQSELTLVFNDDSWVDVEDARGNKLVYRLAKAGLSRTVTGVAPFDVQLGYASVVEIFYNGRPYDMSRYAGRRSARFRVGHAGDRMTDE